MIKLAPQIWIAESEFKLLGADMGNRMTIIRCTQNRLLLHSPIPLNVNLLQDLQELGEVRYIVTPNCYHGIFAQECCAQFPAASHYSAHRDHTSIHSHTIVELMNAEISSDIKIIHIDGIPKLNEYAFIHLPSKTLILTDLALNIRAPTTLLTQWFFRLNGAYNRFAPTRILKSLITNPSLLKLSLNKILKYDIKRIIVSHGDLIEDDAANTLRNAFASCINGEPRSTFNPKASISRCG